jgi:pyrroline-5-carboxylate reductase
MATALARGFTRAGLLPAGNILASDPQAPARAAFQRETGARVASSNLEVVREMPVVVLSVKPDQVDAVLDEISGQVSDGQVLISIAAGVTLARLSAHLSESARVVRVMPNTPALVGASATAYALGPGARPEDGGLVARLFTSVGIAYEVKEALVDAVTGLSGSGPAYVCLMIEALSDGGVAAGLPREIATELAAQTVLGTARMVLETRLHPGVLKDMVASPGGTTIEGLHQLEIGGLRGALMNAVRAAAEKSRRLGSG